MSEAGSGVIFGDNAAKADGATEGAHGGVLLRTRALQHAILNSSNFAIIATDRIMQLFNIGAERMLGYLSAEVVNKISTSDINDPQEVSARALALSRELATYVAPGFEALAFKASRGIEDIYELTLQGWQSLSGNGVDHGAAR